MSNAPRSRPDTPPLLLAVLDTTYQLTPALICLVLLLAFGMQTTDGRHIEWSSLSEWSFLSAFLYLSVLRDRFRPQLNAQDANEHLLVYFIGCLAVFSGVVLAILYVYNTGLLQKPQNLGILVTIQWILLAGALSLNTYVRYQEYAVKRDA